MNNSLSVAVKGLIIDKALLGASGARSKLAIYNSCWPMNADGLSLCILLNVFQSFVFYGTQMYFGGQAFVIILNSLSRSFLHMKNTLPARYERAQ